MVRNVVAVLFLTLGIEANARGAALAIERSTPANGAKNVPVDIGKLEIVFNQRMNTASHTLQTVQGCQFPPISLKGVPWKDTFTYVLTLQRLQPNTTYGVQLNGVERKGFVSFDGVPLPITTILFTTGPEGGGAGGPGSTMTDMFPRGMGPAAPAGYRLVKVVDDFIAYHDRCKGLGEAQRAAQWDALLEGKYPDYFNQVIYRNKAGADRERIKGWCIRTFWSEVAPKMASIRALSPGIAAEIAEMVRSFQGQFPDFKPSTDFYVTVSFSFRGKVTPLNGKDVFGLGLEHFEPGQPQLRITIAHELFHLYHYQTFDAGRGLYRSLWAEGLASYASAVLVPGQRLSVILGFPAEKMNRCQQMLPALARELKQHLGDSDEGIKRIYFGAEPNETQVPPEAGYYVGYLIVANLAKTRPLADLAKMDAKTVYGVLDQELARLAGGP